MYIADLRRLFASFCGKLIFSAASMDRLPSTLAINCPQHAHTVLCLCGTYLHMRTDPEALGFSSNFKWKSTINKQLNNKTEVIGILPVGKQVQMTRVVSSIKLQSRKDWLFPHFLLWVDGQILPFQISLYSFLPFVQIFHSTARNNSPPSSNET